MHRLLLGLLLIAPLAREAEAFTCPYTDVSTLTDLGVGCPVVVYVEETLADPALPTRVVVDRGGVPTNVATSRSIVIESREVEHTAYCGDIAVAMRTDTETFQKITFEVDALVAGEAVTLTNDAGDVLAQKTVLASAPCHTEPLMDTWCGSSWPGDCPQDPADPNDPGDPDGGGSNGGGCRTGGAAHLLLGLLLLPLLVRKRIG